MEKQKAICQMFMLSMQITGGQGNMASFFKSKERNYIFVHCESWWKTTAMVSICNIF